MTDEQLNINSLDKLYFSTFSFTAEATEDIYISEFKGSTFHGGFGNAFKKLVCINPKEKVCDNCIVNANCSYYKIFDSRIDEETLKKLKITNTAPRPYVLEPPNTIQRKFNKGELFHFNLVLIGWAVEYLPYFIIVFEQLGEKYGIGKRVNGKRGKFKILNVRSWGKVIYENAGKILKQDFERITVNSFPKIENANRIKINFVTPVRLEVRHKTQMLDLNSGFTTFILRLYSRLFRLQEIYCGDIVSEYNQKDLEKLSRLVKTVYTNLTWYDMERVKKIYLLNEVEKIKMKYGGFIGEAAFEGELAPFINIIKLGEYLHVGKYYTFGLGKYEIL